MNFYTHKLNDESIINDLVIPAKLNNGKALNYAQGIVSDKYKGWRQYSHGGADAGYRTYLSVFPDLKLGFLVFSNLGEENPGGKAYTIAEYFIKDSTKSVTEIKKLRDSAAAVLTSASSYSKFTGDYISDNGLDLNLFIKNNQLHYKVDWESNFLIREKNDTFSIPNAPNIKFFLSIKSKDTLLDIFFPDETHHLVKYKKDTSVSDEKLKFYVGRYYCPELECFYGIEMKDHQLYLTNAKYSDTKLNWINKDHLKNDFWWIGHLKVRWKQNEVEGFDVNAGRIMHLRFDKIK
jgi:hypothetical protein